MTKTLRSDKKGRVIEKLAQERDALRAQRDELLAALKFARSVIKSGEPWTRDCEHTIDTAIRKAKEAG